MDGNQGNQVLSDLYKTHPQAKERICFHCNCQAKGTEEKDKHICFVCQMIEIESHNSNKEEEWLKS